jgi:hypothetical protein
MGAEGILALPLMVVGLSLGIALLLCVILDIARPYTFATLAISLSVSVALAYIRMPGEGVGSAGFSAGTLMWLGLVIPACGVTAVALYFLRKK